MAVQTMVRNKVEHIPTAEIFKYLPDGNVLSESVVINPATVAADAEGVKSLYAGTLLCRITSGGATGEYGPYDAAATDGRQTLTPPAGGAPQAGILSMDLDLTDGAKAAGLYYGNCQFATSKLRLLGATLSAVKAAIPACWFL